MATCSTSSIDLTICSNSIAPHLDCTVLSDLYGCNHYSVFIHISTPWSILEYSPHCMLTKVDWTIFKQSINHPTEATEGINNKADCFTIAVLSAMPISTGKACHPPVPWWTVQLTSMSGNESWVSCATISSWKSSLIIKKLWLRVCHVIWDSRKSSWRVYVSSLTNRTSSVILWQKIKKWKECGPPLQFLV